MFVFDGDKNFNLTKNNTIYSGKVKINNTASQIVISGINLSNEKLIFYIYKTSK